MRHDIELELVWIPRDENEKADYLSRIVDHDDWSLNPLLFQLVVLGGLWVLIRSTVFRLFTIISCKDSHKTPDIGTQAVRRSMPSTKTGPGRIIGFVRQFLWLLEQLNTWPRVKWQERWLFLSGLHPISGRLLIHVQVLCMHLGEIGLFCHLTT